MLLLNNIGVIDLKSCVSSEQKVDGDDELTAIGVHLNGGNIIILFIRGGLGRPPMSSYHKW